VVVDNQINSAVWETTDECPLFGVSLQKLFENKIPLIRIRQFATLQECDALVAQANLLGFDAYKDVTPKIERIGITVFEYNSIGKADYFQAVDQAGKKQHHITCASFNPLQRLMGLLKNHTGATVRIASDNSPDRFSVGQALREPYSRSFW